MQDRRGGVRLGHTGANRLAIRMDQVDGHDICRVDIPASSRPIWVKNPQGADTLYQRRNNSTRAVPADELDLFLTDRFGRTGPIKGVQEP